MKASEILRRHVGSAVTKKVSCKLLRDRAAALQSMLLVKIRDECTGDSDGIYSMMSEETLVFTRRHGIHELSLCP
jgi:hypothetical protein